MKPGYDGTLPKDPDRTTDELDPAEVRKGVAAADAAGTTTVSPPVQENHGPQADPWQ